MAEPSSSLSARAQEILQRADAQLTALRRPAPRAPQPAEPASADDLGQLLDTVQAGIEAARAHLSALGASLDRIAQELGHVAVSPAPPAPPAPVPPALQTHVHPPLGSEPEPEPEPAPEVAPEPVALDRRTTAAHDAARLVAIEMAVAGDTREVVGRRLREEFGIADPRTILDDVFGPDAAAPGRGYGV